MLAAFEDPYPKHLEGEKVRLALLVAGFSCTAVGITAASIFAITHMEKQAEWVGIATSVGAAAGGIVLTLAAGLGLHSVVLNSGAITAVSGVAAFFYLLFNLFRDGSGSH